MSGARPPQIGDPAPAFTLPDADGVAVSLADLLGHGPLVLFFYPQDDTPGCTVEACSFRDSHQDFVTAGAAVAGISRDDAASHTRFAQKYSLPFRLLSDPTGKVHDSYGVKRRIGGLVRDRISFVIDRTGVVRLTFDSKVRFADHSSLALQTVRALASAPSP